jgi:hypothetical protein
VEPDRRNWPTKSVDVGPNLLDRGNTPKAAGERLFREWRAVNGGKYGIQTEVIVRLRIGEDLCMERVNLCHQTSASLRNQLITHL